MHLQRKTLLVACSCLLLFSAAPQLAYAQEQLDANAKLCDEYFRTIVVGGKTEEASKYLTDDFIEHNVRLLANDLPAFVEKLKAFRAAAGGRGFGGGQQPQAKRTVFSHTDVVVFIQPLPERDDPAHPGQRLPAASHFDVYRLRNGKIAEHWD